ncbi:MAG: twin-arginine translocation pathway signal [Rhodobacteraceae bacterium]|nr:twin-arginine translocation pathway signal [Paracoccaceae bacterium]
MTDSFFRTPRRALVAAIAASLALAACGNGVGNSNADVIDARVEATRAFLFDNFPGTRELADEAEGILFIPLVTEAGLGVGGSYGRGALQIDGATVDYYSATRATIGLQIGAQQFAHALFFMTPEALADFRTSDGWAVGADVRYALPDQGGSIGVDTTTGRAPVIAVVFGQAGLLAGATLGGIKYTRIIP